jgi:hypothetical protein
MAAYLIAVSLVVLTPPAAEERNIQWLDSLFNLLNWKNSFEALSPSFDVGTTLA